MNKFLSVLFFILITNFWIIQTQCPIGTTLNSQGECQCNTAGKYLDIDLAETLNALDADISSYTNIISDLFDFDGGETGNCILLGQDGTNDFNGNFLMTNLQYDFISYSQKTIVQSADLGGKKYFTAKFPGLFVFVGQINIETFAIHGDTGISGSGTKDGGELSATINGISYKGFFTRIFEADNMPSINHLIIVEDNGSLENLYTFNTSDDNHSVKNLQNVPWLVYLTFGTWDNTGGTCVDDSILQQLMTTFLSSKLQKSDCTRSCPSACNTCISYFSCRECISSKYLDGNECKGTYFYCQ